MIHDWGPDVLFGQVREDAAVEVAALGAASHADAVLCIGSAGCSAFSLLTLQPDRLFVVDINAAQCMLLHLKKAALEHVDQHSRLIEFLDFDARPGFDHARAYLSPEVQAFWDRRRNRLRHGLNHCGQVDRRLALAMAVFRHLVPIPWVAGQRETWRWRAAFRLGLSYPVLRLAYAPSFLQDLPADFPELMRRQVEAAFDAAPLDRNPYIQQTFFGQYSSMLDYALPIYAQRQHLSTVRAGLERTEVIQADVAAWLEQQPPASLDFCALSNILEVTPPTYTLRLWTALAHSTAPGGLVSTRSIFPRPVAEPLTIHGRFTYLRDLSESLAGGDRSPFCRFIQIHRLEA